MVVIVEYMRNESGFCEWWDKNCILEMWVNGYRVINAEKWKYTKFL